MSDLDAQDLPVIYTFRRCPYAMRARLAIAVSGIKVEWREIILRDKPAHMVEISPKATVPVLQLPDGHVIDESFDIMLWALGERDPDGWLPDDDTLKEQVMTAIKECDWTFKYHLDRYKYPNRYEGAISLDHRDAALVSLEKWNERLGSTRHLFGSKPGLADFAIFPFIRQFANVDRDWFDGLEISHLQAWLEGHLQSDLFARIMEKRALWQPGDEAVFF